MKVAVIDDSEDSVIFLQTLLADYFPQAQVMGTFTNSQKALKEIDQLDIDILFLDIEMPIMNGLEFMEFLPKEKDFFIVVISAKKEYALESIKYGVADYILKPISIRTMKECLDRLSEKLSVRNAKKTQRIIVNRHDKLVILKMEEILLIKADGPYCEIITSANLKIASSKPIGYYEQLLDDSFFYKVNRSLIINENHVVEMLKENNGDGILVMNNGLKIPISKNKRYEFAQRYK